MLFEDEPYYRMIQLISGIYLKTRHWTERQIKILDMTYPQLGALIVLSQHDGITQREMANRLETDATTVMVLCDSLEKKSWLRRVPDKTDRRVNRLVLTDNGNHIYREALSHIQSGYSYMVKSIPRFDDLNGTISLLESLDNNLREMMQPGPESK
jgi:DNA-binding MarR family transcriptional regulator